MKLGGRTLRYRSRKSFEGVLRMRLRQLAGWMPIRVSRVKSVVMPRECQAHLPYRDERLIVRTKRRRGMALRLRTMTTDLAARLN